MSKPIAFIVEDDPDLGKIFSISLQTDFKTEVAGDGNIALLRLAQIVPQIIILDLHVPGTPGKDILDFIHSDARLATTHVILCTADERQAEALQEKVDIVLLKPVSPAQLRQIGARFK